MRLAYSLIPFLLATASFADTLTLRSGQQVQGTYIGGSARQIKMAVGDQVQSFDVVDVKSLVFNANVGGGGGQAVVPPAPEPQAAAPPPPAPPPVEAPPSRPAPPAQNTAQSTMIRPDPAATCCRG